LKFVCLFVSMGVRGKPRMYCSLLAYCTARFGRSNFGHQMPRAYRRGPHSSGGSWNLWAGIGPGILPKCRLPRYIYGSFTCPKSATWDPRFYFPSEGRRAENFSALKNLTASAGFEPANLGTRGQHANPPRPPKPLLIEVFLRKFWS
jgi:hypothetical protein